MKEQMKLLSEAMINSPCLKVGSEIWAIENVNVRMYIIESIKEVENSIEVRTAEGSVITLRPDDSLIMA